MGAFLMPGNGDEMADYPDFVESTGFGEVDGLLGVNCRHSFAPFFPDFQEPRYTAADLTAMNVIEYTYTDRDGNKRTVDTFEATQRQREIERHIRSWKRRLGVRKTIRTHNIIPFSDMKTRRFFTQTACLHV